MRLSCHGAVAARLFGLASDETPERMTKNKNVLHARAFGSAERPGQPKWPASHSAIEPSREHQGD